MATIKQIQLLNTVYDLEVESVTNKNPTATITEKIDWVGTQEEYNTQREAGEIPDHWVCFITDDISSESGEIDLSNYIKKTGNESISGTKTFNDTLELKSNLSFRSYGTNNSGRLQFRAQPSDNVIRGTMAITDGYSTSGSGYNGFVAQMVARSGSTNSDPFNSMRVSNKGIEYIKEANDGTITGQYIVVNDNGLVPSDRLSTSGSTGQVLTKTASGQSWQTIDVSDEVNSLISVMLATLYPVGSIYIGTQSTCPISTLIPGSTWELVSAGRTLQGADSSHTAGSTIEAGLPNITGEFAGNGWIMTQTNNTTKGAITTGSTTSIHYGGTSGSGVDRFFVDASNSNPIYGKSTTVQPPAYVVNIWRRTA